MLRRSGAEGEDRAATPRELPIHQLVPGDHIVLSAGDMIPSDCRVLTAKDLFVSQSAMTGESLPVEKFAERSQPGTSVLDATNLLFMGTNVVSGSIRPKRSRSQPEGSPPIAGENPWR